jgi:hypothetical protein
MRRGALIDGNRAELAASISRYADPEADIETLQADRAGPVFNMARFDATKARNRLLAKGGLSAGRIARYALYPLELRWCFHTNVRPIWNEPRPALAVQQKRGTSFLIGRMSAERPREGLPVYMTQALPDYHLLRPNVQAIPLKVWEDGKEGDLFSSSSTSRANLSAKARGWLSALGWHDPDSDSDAGAAPWLHALAIGLARRESGGGSGWLATNPVASVSGRPISIGSTWRAPCGSPRSGPPCVGYYQRYSGPALSRSGCDDSN